MPFPQETVKAGTQKVAEHFKMMFKPGGPGHPAPTVRHGTYSMMHVLQYTLGQRKCTVC